MESSCSTPMNASKSDERMTIANVPDLDVFKVIIDCDVIETQSQSKCGRINREREYGMYNSV